MHLKDGMLTKNLLLKIVILLIILVLPLIFSGVSFSQSVLINDADFNEHLAPSKNLILTAGNFQYFDVSVSNDIKCRFGTPSAGEIL